MLTSLYKIAEKAKDILGKGDLQAIISTVQDCYATVAKSQWYENKQDGISEVDGEFIYTFTDQEPILDIGTDMYYIIIPSSYLRLPHEMGINTVSLMHGQTKPFVRIGAGSIGMWANLKANVLGGKQTYYVEGVRMYFPKMTIENTGPLLLKLAVALDTVDVEDELNISPSVVDTIVNMVVAKYMPKEEKVPNNLV